MSVQSDAAGAAAGGAGYLLVKIFGWISVATISQAFILGMASATGGYLVKKIWDLIIKTIILKLKKNEENERI